jgi:hypothetical protein
VARDERRKTPVASIAGASAGTGLVGAAHLLPPGWAGIRDILIYLAPGATVGFRFGWLWLADWAASVAEQRGIAQLVADAEAAVRRIHANPASTPRHKQQAQAKLEALQMLQIELITDRSSRVRVKFQEARKAAREIIAAAPRRSGRGGVGPPP